MDLFGKFIILIGFVAVHMVNGRTTVVPVKPVSACPTLTEVAPDFCMMQTKQDKFPCQQDGDCFISGQVCCPHYCNTKVCTNTNASGNELTTSDNTATSAKPMAEKSLSKAETESTTSDGTATSAQQKSSPTTVPTNIKHPQNVPTMDELAKEYEKPQPKTVKSLSTGSPVCPTLREVTPEFCMMQTEQDKFPCQQDGDCFVPGQVCCPHYCNTKVCTNTNVENPTNDSTDTSTITAKSKQRPATVPTNIKNPQNVPTMDEIAKEYAVSHPKASESTSTNNQSNASDSKANNPDDKSKMATATTTPIVNDALKINENIQTGPVLDINVDTVVVSGSKPSDVVIQPAKVQTTSNPPTTTTTTTSTLKSFVSTSEAPVTSGELASTTEKSTPSSASSIDSAIVSVNSSVPTGVTKTNCPSVTCSNSCMYGRKVDTEGCTTCDCLHNDQCPAVVPIRNRMLCALRLTMALNTCEDDGTCRQGSICCPDACGNKVCQRIAIRSLRTLSMSLSV